MPWYGYNARMRRNTKAWWLLRIVGWTLAGLAAGWIASYFWPESYISEATLRLVPSIVSQDLLPHDPVDIENFLERERTIVLSRNLLTTIINNFDLYRSERKRLPMEDVVEEFRKSVRIESPGANLIRVAFTYDNRFLANKVTQDLASRIINESITTRSNMVAATAEFFQDQVEKVGKSWLTLSAKVKITPASDPGYELLAFARDQKRKEYESMEQKLGIAQSLKDLAGRGQDMHLELLDAASLPQQASIAGILLVGLGCGLAGGLLPALRRALRRRSGSSQL